MLYRYAVEPSLTDQGEEREGEEEEERVGLSLLVLPLYSLLSSDRQAEVSLLLL